MIEGTIHYLNKGEVEMKKQTKILITRLVALFFLATPMLALAGGHPPGDNSAANVGVPKGWTPKVEGQSAGKPGRSKFPPGDNSAANVGVPKEWEPTSEASSWGSSGSQSSRLPKDGNDRANVGVPKAWMPK